MWHQVGSDFYGNNFGTSIALSGNGRLVTVGSVISGNEAIGSGYVHVYHINSNALSNGTVASDQKIEQQCKTNESMFKLEIVIDEFPQDIFWEFSNMDGKRLPGEYFWKYYTMS